MWRKIWTGVGLAAALGLAAAGLVVLSQDDYELRVLMPTAVDTHEGTKVMLDGEQVGEVADLDVRDGQALVTVLVDSGEAPFHAGTTARINWEGVIGSRHVELLPGSEDNPALPSGKMITSKIERVEIDQLLATLDESTRERVQALVKRLNESLQGNEQNLKATVETGGPAVEALGEVLRAVGEDGPAIRDLVTRLEAMTEELAQRDTEVARSIENLGQLTSVAAGQQEALSDTLDELPSTVREASETLDQVPEAVHATAPLLDEVQPATERLPSVAGNLRPVLQDMRPTVAEITPTLVAAEQLLVETPDLLDSAHATLPEVNEAVNTLQPAVEFLRPYTPELTGWLSNWTSVFASQSSGNYARALIVESASTVNDNPGVVPPGMKQEPRPSPGSVVDQSWTDANGDGVQ
ncbi:phospholipid/cholesterol/gamma-HCH transport system substrate-binding protein [Haloechinothrix alba]|uniref:Phospholipid/cholesterol/gamma-HCH transport system substrate-binding protein n=1 Tax=Haloechinothrix alba TaxID=664784 RepID=A0A239AAE1_9PSEU|nr:MlaD family protein [Haloechinothrix alba]SNR92372.1 phospholipid/cholesterol/gamma-HCH transport system substrate-binding protein [Haloechinothrix alba]